MGEQVTFPSPCSSASLDGGEALVLLAWRKHAGLFPAFGNAWEGSQDFPSACAPAVFSASHGYTRSVLHMSVAPPC